MRYGTIASGALGLAAVLAAAVGVRAQAPAAGGLFTAGKGPIDIGSDNGAERYQNEGRVVWHGNVDVTQGDTRLRTPQLTIYSAKGAPGAKGAPPGADGTGNIERVEAEGPVYYVTPTQQVKGDHGTYIAANDTITVIGNVTLLQGQDVLHGDKLVIEQKTGVSRLTNDNPGKGSQRVRGVFFPKDSNTTGQSGTAPPAAKPGA